MSKAKAAEVRVAMKAWMKVWGWNPSGIIGLLRGGGNALKGGQYERFICKRFSEWWTGGIRDDVFWRTSNSGARATVRGRQGKGTAGQYGDMGAIDPIGAPLIDMFTIEIKRGYSEHSVQDVLDRPVDAGVQEWERWFSQAIEASEQAGSYSWLLITRRDRRVPLVWMPRHVIYDLRSEMGWPSGPPKPYITLKMEVRDDSKGVQAVDAVGMTLEAFLAGVSKATILKLAERV